MGESSVEWTAGGITLRGDIDMGQSLPVRRALEQAGASGLRSIAVDVSQLDFIDSSGLNELVRPIHNGQRVVLDGAKPSLCRLLEMTQLGSVLRVRSGDRDDELDTDEAPAGSAPA